MSCERQLRATSCEPPGTLIANTRLIAHPLTAHGSLYPSPINHKILTRDC